MADLSRKKPIPAAMREAAVKAAREYEEMRPKSLPARVVSVSGGMVTVSVEVQGPWTLRHLTVPVFGSEYVRCPIQPEDRGVIFGLDASVDNVSGQTQSIAELVSQGALSSVAFLPISNQQWAGVDGDTLCLMGPSGVSLYDRQKNSIVTISQNGVSITSNEGITLSSGGASISVKDGKVSITGTLVINGMAFTAHTHTNGNQGAPTGGVVV